MNNQDDSKYISSPQKPDPNFFHKVVKGGGWMFALRIAQQLLAMVRLVILARLLAPEDFGVLGIALLTMATAAIFTQTGFQSALVQKKENVHAYLNAAWTAGIIRGFFLFAILYVIAPYAVEFFSRSDQQLNVPEATLIIKVLAISVLISSFSNIGTIYFSKELNFEKQFCRQIISVLVNTIVSIVLAVIYKSVWALVAGRLAGTITKLLLSYILHPYRPSFSRDWTQIKELWVFGKWIFVSSILGFVVTQGDDIFVGKLIGVTALGLYQMAYKISYVPVSEITGVVTQVAFPAYSKLQDDLARLGAAYLKVLQFTTFLSFPLAGLVFIMAPSFVKLFMLEKWEAIIAPIQIMAIAGLCSSVGTTTGSLFRSVGRPSITTKLVLMKLFMLAALIYPLTTRWGISGAALAVSLSTLLVQALVLYAVKTIIKCSFWPLAKQIVLPLCATSVMITVMCMLKFFLINNLSYLTFSLLVIIGVAVYLGTILFCDRFFNHGIMFSIREQLSVFLPKTNNK